MTYGKRPKRWGPSKPRAPKPEPAEPPRCDVCRLKFPCVCGLEVSAEQQRRIDEARRDVFPEGEPPW